MFLLKVLAGVLLVGMAYELENRASEILLFEGLFLLHYGLRDTFNKKSIQYK